MNELKKPEQNEKEIKNYSVYAHINKINGKIYIGVTSQIPKRRWGKNGNGYKTSRYFWNAIQKYKWENFHHDIIAEHLTKNEAENFEKRLIKELKSKNSKFGYNLTDGGDGMTGAILTDEARKNRSLAQKGKHIGSNNSFYGKHHSKKTREYLSKLKKGKYKGGDSWNSKRVICINTNMVFNSITEAAKYYNIKSSTSILLNCQGEKKCGGEFDGEKLMWAYYDENYNPSNYINLTYKRPGTREVICLTTGKIFKSAAEAGRYYNIDKSQISSCCNHKYGYNTTRGIDNFERFEWAFYDKA